MSKEFEEKHKEAFLDYLTREVDNSGVNCVLHDQPVKDCDDALCEIVSSSSNELEEFDMYARDIKDYYWLKQFIPGIIIYSAGGMCPFQAEGYLGDYNFYYRERSGVASLRLAHSKKECYGSYNALYSASLSVEEFREGPGWFSTLMNLVERLEKTPYLYNFQSDEISFGPDGNSINLMSKKLDENGQIIHVSRAGWGFTAEEAFKDACEGVEESRNYFCNKEQYDKELGEFVPDPERSWTNEQFDKYVELSNLQFVVLGVEGNDRKYPEIDPVFEVKVPEVWRNEEGFIEIPNDVWLKAE